MSVESYEEKIFSKPCECCGVVEWQLGREYERNRIIALLEAKSDWYYEKAIEAIKGETK